MQEILQGDCLEVMKSFPDNHFTSIITDPPYGLHFMGKGWDHGVPDKSYWIEAFRICKPGSILLAFGGTRTYHRLACAIEDAGWEIRDCICWLYGQGFPKSHNFGCKCKGIPVSYNHEETTKTPPKSSLRSMSETDLSQTMSNISTKDEAMFARMSKQDLQSIRPMSCQGDEIRKESSLERGSNFQEDQRELHRSEICQMSNRMDSDGEEGWICNGTSTSDGQTPQQNSSESGSSSSQRSQYTKQSNRESGTIQEQQRAQDRRGKTCETCKGIIGFSGYGTALKPSHEPIIMAMKPLDGTFKQNAEKWGVSGINIDACRIISEEIITTHNRGITTSYCKRVTEKTVEESGRITPQNRQEFIGNPRSGRWPANLILDEEAAQMLDQQTGTLTSGKANVGLTGKEEEFFKGKHNKICSNYADSGGASRFFYCAKASSAERNKGLENMPLKQSNPNFGSGGFSRPTDQPDRETKPVANHHPTVKPIALMEYLIKLVMPPKDGLILDPFAGSGTTIIAAKRLGHSAIGIEKEPEYAEIATKRLEAYKREPEQMELAI